METLIERCAGLDVHKDSVVACVRVPDGHGGRHAETRGFTTTTAGLVLLVEWLVSFGVTRVGMESTGCYWKPVWQLLEGQVECWLAQRGPYAQRAGAQDRRGRRGLDRPAGRARPGPPRASCHPDRSASCAT